MDSRPYGRCDGDFTPPADNSDTSPRQHWRRGAAYFSLKEAMMDTNVLSSGRDILSLVIFAFLCILAILWILVPFAVFGVKSLLHSLIAEQRRTNQSLEALSEQLRDSALRPVVLHDPAPGTRVVDTGPTPG
jgi:hypothetical protein